MKFSKLVLAVLVMVAFGMSSCKKDDKTLTETMLDGKWKVTAITVNGVDFMPLFDACDLDNTVDFQAGGVSVSDEGAILCSPGDPQTTTDTYSISADEKSVTLGTGGDAMTFTITSFSDSKIVLTNVKVDAGVTTTSVYTLGAA